jgi:riboflavin kinase/FMN adenylyltransferase
MRLIRWPGEEPASGERSVVTLGVFDGVHRGHAEVIRRVVTAARERSCRAVIVTFDRHPAAVLSGEPLPVITSLEHRVRLFAALGTDLCVVVRFCEDVARIEAAEFARRVFHELLHAELVVLGYDCRFGRNGQGDLSLSARLGRELGFEVEGVPAVVVDGRPVSSTDVRQAILSGDLERAQRLLGRPFSLYGTVVRGDARGAALGYPTANLDLHNEAVPPDGVYAAWAFTDGEPLLGVVSIGRRATFHREAASARVVEVHLVDRREDLYGRDIEVQFAGWLRDQETFDSTEYLKAQIERDVRAARRMLRGRAPRR